MLGSLQRMIGQQLLPDSHPDRKMLITSRRLSRLLKTVGFASLRLLAPGC